MQKEHSTEWGNRLISLGRLWLYSIWLLAAGGSPSVVIGCRGTIKHPRIEGWTCYLSVMVTEPLVSLSLHEEKLGK